MHALKSHAFLCCIVLCLATVRVERFLCVQFYCAHFLLKGRMNMKRKKLRTVIIVFVALALIASIANAIGERGKKIVWEDVVLSETLPKPSKCRGKIYTNSSKELWVKIFKTSDKMYYDYVESCKDFGYVVDAMSDANTYTAFNNDGYKLSLNYSSDKIMSIHLYEPIKMNTIIWPLGEIGKILPVPKSNIGDILYEYENSFCAYIGNTSFDDYNEYVSACIKQGFNIDYNRNDNLFYADNADGWRVSISYEGFNIMKIDIHNNEKNKKETSISSEETFAETTTETTEETTAIEITRTEAAITQEPVYEPETAYDSSNETVYITDSGNKYHRSGCRTLKKSKHAISKSSAVKQGYEACGVCHP